jgi:hypothetical protein
VALNATGDIAGKVEAIRQDTMEAVSAIERIQRKQLRRASGLSTTSPTGGLSTDGPSADCRGRGRARVV